MTLAEDTIYALSSGGLPSGVAVIRISGPHASEAFERLCSERPRARSAKLTSIRNRNNEIIDRGLVLFFPSPASFTGEDCVELQVHGGKAVVSSILVELSFLKGYRHAESGEFSRRAFQNGKFDLVEIEGLADLIAAETEMQLRLASEHAQGGMSLLYGDWARRLTHARAMIEAELDFADEEDVPGSVANLIWDDMRAMRDEIQKHLDQASIGEIIRDGFRIVIAGPPNAGKSSLLNYLAKREVAIVTEVAGTTRDILSVDLDIGGFAVKLFDTAGLRETEEIVEREGIRRAYATMEEADLILVLSDGSRPWISFKGISPDKILKIGTKSDQIENDWLYEIPDIYISTKNGSGCDALIEHIRSFLPKLSGHNAFSLPTRSRHVDCLKQVIGFLDDSFALAAMGLDVQAEQLRLAAHALGKITGKVDVENLLDVIFSEFCIGK